MCYVLKDLKTCQKTPVANMLLKDFFSKFSVNKTAFAKKSEVSLSQLNRILKGTVIPTLRTAKKISEATGDIVTLPEILNIHLEKDQELHKRIENLEKKLETLEKK